MEHEKTYHVYTQQDTYITDEIWKEGGTIDLFLGDIYEDMEDRLMVFRKADMDEFKELVKDTIINYIYTCQLRNGGKFFTDLKNADPVHEWVSEKILERRFLDTAYIVKLRAWYWNERMEDSIIFNEILAAPEIDHFVWDNDWYEGQENVAIYAIYGLNDLDLQDNV